MEKQLPKKDICFICGKAMGEFSPETGGSGWDPEKGRYHFLCKFPEKAEEVRERNRSNFNEL